MVVRWLLLSLMAFAAGCSSGGPNYRVSGKATFAGQPIPTGTVLFEPDASKDNRGRGVMAEIKDGAYQTPPGKGIVGGPHILRIVGFDGKGDARGESLRGRPLFPELTRTFDFPKADAVHDLEIPAK